MKILRLLLPPLLFQDAWGYLAVFSVVFGPQGTVIGATSRRINDGGDHGK